MGYVINYKRWAIQVRIKRMKRRIKENADDVKAKEELDNLRKDLEELSQP